MADEDMTEKQSSERIINVRGRGRGWYGQVNEAYQKEKRGAEKKEFENEGHKMVEWANTLDAKGIVMYTVKLAEKEADWNDLSANDKAKKIVELTDEAINLVRVRAEQIKGKTAQNAAEVAALNNLPIVEDVIAVNMLYQGARVAGIEEPQPVGMEWSGIWKAPEQGVQKVHREANEERPEDIYLKLKRFQTQTMDKLRPQNDELYEIPVNPYEASGGLYKETAIPKSEQLKPDINDSEEVKITREGQREILRKGYVRDNMSKELKAHIEDAIESYLKYQEATNKEPTEDFSDFAQYFIIKELGEEKSEAGTKKEKGWLDKAKEFGKIAAIWVGAEVAGEFVEGRIEQNHFAKKAAEAAEAAARQTFGVPYGKMAGAAVKVAGAVVAGKRRENKAETDEKPIEEIAQPVEPEVEKTPEAKTGSWKQVNEILEQYVSKLEQGLHPSKSLTDQKELAIGERDKLAYEAKDYIHTNLKERVANLYGKVINEDRQVAAGGGTRDEDPYSRFIKGIDDLRFNVAEPIGKLEGVVHSWLEGVKRNADLWTKRRESSWRTELGLPIDSVLERQIKDIERQIEYLNWGILTSETKEKLNALAEQHINWLMTAGPDSARYLSLQKAIDKERVKKEGGTPVNAETKEIKATGDMWSENFLQKHGLPKEFIIPPSVPGDSPWKIETAAMLEAAYNTNSIPVFLNPQTREGQFFALACASQEEAQLFYWGILPWVRVITSARNDGKFSSLIDQKSGGGLIPEMGLSLRGMALAFKNDADAKRALAIFLQMNPQTNNRGERIIQISNFMPQDDVKFAQSKEDEYRRALLADPLEWDHPTARAWLKGLASKVAEQVGCDRGTAEIMAEVATMINSGPKMLEYRGIIKKHVLQDPKDNTRGILRRVPSEDAALPLIAKIFVKKEDGKFNKMDKYLNEGGVDEMFDVMKSLYEDRWYKAIIGMSSIKTTMDTVVNLLNWKGEAVSMPDKLTVKAKISELVSGLTSLEFPLLQRETQQLIMNLADKMEEKVGASVKDAAPKASDVAKEVGWGMAGALTFGIAPFLRSIIKQRRS